MGLINDKNYAPEKLGTACILGLGKTGYSTAEYLCKLLGTRLDSLHIYAGTKTEFSMRSADKFLAMGASVSFDDTVISHNYDLCVASPGVPQVSDLMISAQERCAEVLSEVEFAWRECNKNCKWIAITGTNGKTTTTSLITHILKNANKRAVSVGNIGKVALDAVAENDRRSIYEHTEYFVAELSSYQLTLCQKFKPEIAVLLNITPDHLDWHGGFDEYKSAKFKIFDNAITAVVNAQDQVISSNLKSIKSKVENLIKNFSDNKSIVVDYNGQQLQIVDNKDLQLIGDHNYENARAAASACFALGLSADQISQGLLTFPPLEHRLEPCGILAGVRLFNDSKATNVDSVLMAINSFPAGKAIFLMGGKDKGTDLSTLVKKSLHNLKGVILYGEAKERFYQEFLMGERPDNFILQKSDNMKTSFKLGMELSTPGDFLVLSPACSSFDEFSNFEQRGDVFKQLIEKCKS